MTEIPTIELQAWLEQLLADRDAQLTAALDERDQAIAALTERVVTLEASGPSQQTDFIGALAITGVPQELQDQLKQHIRDSIGTAPT